jgi:hypothetical protein
MGSTVDLHDAEVVSIASDRDAQQLTLGVRFPGGRRGSLAFSGVLGWDLSPFVDQNVIFEIREYDGASPPTHLWDEMPAAYRDAISSGQHRCYEIDASVGLGGYVIAAGLVTDRSP